jgi:hypothetical protein
MCLGQVYAVEMWGSLFRPQPGFTRVNVENLPAEPPVLDWRTKFLYCHASFREVSVTPRRASSRDSRGSE